MRNIGARVCQGRPISKATGNIQLGEKMAHARPMMGKPHVRNLPEARLLNFNRGPLHSGFDAKDRVLVRRKNKIVEKHKKRSRGTS